MKTCNTCGKEKEEKLFPAVVKVYLRARGGFSIYAFTRNKCKKCTSEAMKRRVIESFFHRA